MNCNYKKIIILLIATMVLPLAIFSQSYQYLHLDKADDHIVLENGGGFVGNTNEISMTGWFKCDALGYGQGYMGFRGEGSGTGTFYLIQLGSGVLECRLGTTGGGWADYKSPNNTVIPQVWQHIAWTYNGSAVKLYVNGALKGGKAISGAFNNPDISFVIGKSIFGGDNFVYGGGIDEITVWNKGLSEADIDDMIENELTGNEDGLVLYYKFNQGVPGGDNQTINKLISEVGGEERNADLLNFAMNGETSNFLGTIESGLQAISFENIPNKLVNDATFSLNAEATSGLDVQFEVFSGTGIATLNGNVVTLTGAAGEVIIKASQSGNEEYEPAEDVFKSFMVVDAMVHFPDIDPRSPLAGDVYVPELSKIQLATITTIQYPELFSVQSMVFKIGTETIETFDWGNGHYTAWWKPPAYGAYSLDIIATNNFGATVTETVNINIVAEVADMEVLAVNDVWIHGDAVTSTVEAELPSYLGAFDQITGTLEANCPASGGCGIWDYIANVEAKGHDGKWVEIIRYITPYGVPCAHTIDLTDYMSILQGKVNFRITCKGQDNGHKYDLTLNYSKGTPTYKYSYVDVIWRNTYQFGDYANLQPVELRKYIFPENSVSAVLKLVSTGHGWSGIDDPNQNTGNAAEFYDATHHVWVNGSQTFTQHNWNDCYPNPDACQPQDGTYQYDRAGWCPGSSAPWFDFNMESYINPDSIDLEYIFDEDYVDLCHPNHPDCITGVTCTNCDAGSNPHLIVACNMVSYSNEPIKGEIPPVSVKKQELSSEIMFTVFPNPSDGIINISSNTMETSKNASLELFNTSGISIMKTEWDGVNKTIDISSQPNGVYILKIVSGSHSDVQKIIVQ